MYPVRSLVMIAMLGAVAFLLMAFFNFPFLPAAAFLKYDPSDAVALLAAEVARRVLPAIVPFNAIKGGVNGLMAVALVSVLLRRGATRPAVRG